MPAWPNSTGLVNTHTDAGSDDPEQARSVIDTTITKVKDVIDARSSANGVAALDGTTKVPVAQLPTAANGVAPLDASAKVPLANLPLLPMFSGMQYYTAPGAASLTIPAGVTRVLAMLAGGGGGGAYGATNGVTVKHGGGGGGGGMVGALFDVLPGDTVDMVIGSGGAGGNGPNNDDGSDGTSTTITINRSGSPRGGVEAQGGFGGKSNATQPVGGDGGIGFNTAGVALIGWMFIRAGVGGTGNTLDMGGMGGSNFFTGSGPGGTDGAFGGGGFGSGTGGPDPANAGKPGGVWLLY